jgi:hypothetical protein
MKLIRSQSAADTVAAVDVSCAVRFISGIRWANRDQIKICGLRIATGDISPDGPDHEGRQHRFPNASHAVWCSPVRCSRSAQWATTAAISQAQTQQKISQEDAKYQDTPKGVQQCDGCNFQPPNACKFVEGEIKPDGWCQLFYPKT